MPVIELKTSVAAPASVVFDLSRSIELHKISTAETGEEAIAGKTSGLIGPGDVITWRAKHLGIRQNLTVKITAYSRPFYFTDEMLSGAFKSFKHQHFFEEKDGITIMTDRFEYHSPFYILGKIADACFLKKYMVNLLKERNKIIKDFAENTEKHRAILINEP